MRLWTLRVNPLDLSNKTYDFSALYTSIPHKLLKPPIAAVVHSSFNKRDGSTHYTDIKVGQMKGYFINFTGGGGQKCTQQIRCAV